MAIKEAKSSLTVLNLVDSLVPLQQFRGWTDAEIVESVLRSEEERKVFLREHGLELQPQELVPDAEDWFGSEPGFAKVFAFFRDNLPDEVSATD